MSPAAAGFRRDVQGLRGLSVLLVVAFHAKVSAFAGGFVGVDVFFVLSGYLITRLLWREMEAGTFTYGRFYLRRARRLLPPLFLVLAFCLAMGWLGLPAEAFRALGRHVVAVTAFSSNLSFFAETGYFDRGADLDPLMMTWSLAVEEQFYLLWPVAVLAVFRRGWSGRKFALAMIVLSLGACVALRSWWEPAAFFLLPARIWELMAGCYLAFLPARVGSPRGGEALSALGVLAVLAAACSPVSHPDLLRQLLAVSGAALLIRNVPQSRVVAALLESRPFVFLGDVSYSFYLWHAPILAFVARSLAPFGGITPRDTVVALSTALALAALSTKLLERHFRERSRVGLSRYALASFLIAAMGAAVFGSGGAPGRYGPAENEIAGHARDRSPWVGDCLETYEPFVSQEKCKTGDARGGSVLVWGDSHAIALAPGFVERGTHAGFAVEQRGKSGCRVTDEVDAACRAFNQGVLKYALENAEIETVVMAGFWSIKICDKRAISACSAEKERAVTLRLAEFVDRLERAGKAVILLGDVPELAFSAVECQLARLRLEGLPPWLDRTSGCTMPTEATRQRLEPVHRVFREIVAKHPRVCAPRIMDVLCDETRCRSAEGRRALYVDDDHLTATAARMVVGRLDLDRCLPIKAL